MTSGAVHVERVGAVGVITLDRPARRNALDRAMWQALARAADELAAALPRAVVVTGAGDAFTAGMDVNPDNPMVAGVAAAMTTRDVAPARAMLAEIQWAWAVRCSRTGTPWPPRPGWGRRRRRGW